MWLLFAPFVAFFGYAAVSKQSVAAAAHKIFGPFLIYGPPTASAIDNAAYAQAAALLKASEGYELKAYKDHLGFVTVGIGHKVLPIDFISLGQTISAERAQAFFDADIAKAFAAAKSQAIQIGKYTPEMIAALTSVNFQLGAGWIYDFANTWRDIKTGNISSAIARLKVSKWNSQTPERVAVFINTLNSQFA